MNATSGNITVDSTLKNVGLSVGGHILPQSLNTAATDVIVGVNKVNDLNTVTFTAGNQLSGNNISITANNDINHIYLNDGSGKGVNNSYRAAGTVSYASGKSQALVNVGVMPIINAKNSLKVNANNNTNLFNMAGGLSYGGGAGSVSVNLGSRTTESNLTAVEAHNVANVDVGAVDNNFTGAWSGAGALNFRGSDSGKTSVAMTGAVAVNKVDSTVVSNIASTENLTGAINNTAEKSGALIAAGLGLTVSNASSNSSNYTGAASANVNLSENVVKAVIKDNTAIDSSAIKNVAKNIDTQVTGGVNVSVAVGGKKGVAAGGTGVRSDISNDVNALVEGGTYKTSGAINNIVSTTLTDVAGGVGVSVAQGSESSYGFQGVFTYNKIKNNAHADIKDAAITANALVNSSSDDKNAANAYTNTLTNAGLDVSGDSYAEFAKVGETDSTQKSIESQSTGGAGIEADESVGYKNSDFGNKIITGALAVAGAGDGAAQASLAISDVDNDFKAEVTNSALNIRNKTDINAASNTLDINAAAGAAVSSKGFGAGGSVT